MTAMLQGWVWLFSLPLIQKEKHIHLYRFRAYVSWFTELDKATHIFSISIVFKLLCEDWPCCAG